MLIIKVSTKLLPEFKTRTLPIVVRVFLDLVLGKQIQHSPWEITLHA